MFDPQKGAAKGKDHGRTELMLYVAEPDPQNVTAARRLLTRAGLYGGRVVVMQATRDRLPYADYFANLIVCNASSAHRLGIAPDEVLRMLKPCGGAMYVPRSDAVDQAMDGPVRDGWIAALRTSVDALGEEETRASEGEQWVSITRGQLKGAGSWTHQYADPGNTACSDDQLVRGSIGVLWFGRPGPGRMPSRHASAAAPLAVNGRMFIQGEGVIMAYDSYNGLLLWERNIAGARRLGLKTRPSNLAADDDSLFVVVGDRCLRLDAVTGEAIQAYAGPAGWGEYIACAGDSLYGGNGARVFAVSIDSGEVRWVHGGKSIMPTTVCVGDGRVLFVDRAVTDEQGEQGVVGIDRESRLDRLGKPVAPDVRLVVALDASTGEKQWERPQYVSDCVKVHMSGGELTAMYAKGVYVLCGQPWNGHFWEEFMAGEFSRRSLIALAADDGRLLWSGRKGYRSRPLIVGDWIVAEPWAHGLKTGAEKRRVHPVTGVDAKWQISRPGHHCGNIAASLNALFFRSGTAAYYDLGGDYGTAHFGGQRPGCWINCIPACGVVMMPEASSGCICPYALHCTTVFQPRKTNRMWGLFSAPGEVMPVRRLAINLGAIGDRRDSNGLLWLAYPRPRKDRLALDFSLKALRPADRLFADNADFLSVDGTDDPWIYASGCRGFQACRVFLKKDTQTTDEYTVRLHFLAPADLAAGQCVFSVSLRGRDMLEDFDLAAEAGSRRRAVVKTFNGVSAADTLTIVLKRAGTGSGANPTLCGIEVLAEQFGLAAGYSGRVSFAAPAHIRAGTPYEITEAELSRGNATGGTLFHRHDGAESFSSIAFEPSGSGRFRAVVAGSLTQRPFVYYVQMREETGSSVRAPDHKSLVRVVPDVAPPSPVADLVVSSLRNYRVVLNWQAATDDTGLNGYRVSRRAGDTGPVAEIAALSADVLTFTDRDVEPGQALHYGVRAVDRVERLGEIQVTRVTVPENEPPVNDLEVHAFPNIPEVHLRWVGTVAEDVVRIQVLRGPSEEGPFEAVRSLKDRLALGCSDTGVEAGQEYWYVVKLADKGGLESGVSKPVRARAIPMPDVFLSDLNYVRGIVGWGEIEIDTNAARRPLAMGGKNYRKGLGVHARSELVYDLKPEYRRFVAVVGLDDRKKDEADSSIVAQVMVDDVLLYESPTVRGGDMPCGTDVGIPEGAKQIRLVITGADDGIRNDMADWANAGFVTAERQAE